jgi:hypothetical protein
MKPAPPVPCLVVDRENDDSEEALDSTGLARLASANREDTSLAGKGECRTVCQESNCIFDGNRRVNHGVVTWEHFCWSGVGNKKWDLACSPQASRVRTLLPS